jgi:ADP-ribose pyrophosphatase
MTRKHGPWTIHSTAEKYADPWIKVFQDIVTRPDGASGTYATIQLKSGVCVIAMDSEQNVHLTSEFHYAVGRITIEGVSGGIESDETPENAASRELEEELGLKASTWTYLGRVDPFTAAINSTVDLFLAEGLSSCDTKHEGTEQIEHVVYPLSAAVEMVRRGDISHSPTCVALLRLALDFRITR